MSTTTFLIILALSLSVYAKTEAGLSLENVVRTAPKRTIANTNHDMGLNLIEALNKSSEPENNINTDIPPSTPSQKRLDEESLGFSGNSGALVKKKGKGKKKPASIGIAGSYVK